MTELLDCDEFRRNYDDWSVADHKAFYKQVWDSNPRQSHHALDIAELVFEMYAPETVVEIGGWDGELAVRILERYQSCKKWTNVEICEQAVNYGRVHPRYKATSPDTWFWDEKWTADMLVASHCIEHLTSEHLEKMVQAVDVRWLYFDAPLDNEPTSWWGTSTTHILEVGWDGVTDICKRNGYVLTWASPHATSPDSGGHAQAMVYTRVVSE